MVSIFVDLLGLPPDLAASRSVSSHLCGEVSLQRAQRWSAQKQGSQCHGTGLVRVAEEVKKKIFEKEIKTNKDGPLHGAPINGLLNEMLCFFLWWGFKNPILIL